MSGLLACSLAITEYRGMGRRERVGQSLQVRVLQLRSEPARRAVLVAGSLVIALTIAGCADGDPQAETHAATTEATETVAPTTEAVDTVTPSAQDARPKRYVLHVQASPASAQSIAVRGRTNLPDGTVVSVSASQAFRFMREGDIRASLVGSSSATVENGKFTTKLGPLDYGDLTVGLDYGTGDLEYGPVAVIDNAVTVCAEVQAGEDFDGVPRQPSADVRSAIGPNGEKLKNSPQADIFGELSSTPSYWLEVIARVNIGASRLTSELVDVQGSAPSMKRLAGFCLS